MRFKKYKNNEYLLTEDGIWVRDICQTNSTCVDLNSLSNDSDHRLFLANELGNRKQGFGHFETDNSHNPNVVIVSDGFRFSERQGMLASLSRKDVAIIGVNRSLANWQLLGENPLKRAMNWYLVNNPYAECRKFLPTTHRYFPKCIASNRTSLEFTKRYEGNTYLYAPVPSKHYSGPTPDSMPFVDDYRNPICAAIGVAWSMGAKKLMLFCCDDTFEDERPGAMQLENGFWSYPQQQTSRRVIDGLSYWLKREGVEIADCSHGTKLENAVYISEEEDMKEFFSGV